MYVLCTDAAKLDSDPVAQPYEHCESFFSLWSKQQFGMPSIAAARDATRVAQRRAEKPWQGKYRASDPVGRRHGSMGNPLQSSTSCASEMDAIQPTRYRRSRYYGLFHSSTSADRHGTCFIPRPAAPATPASRPSSTPYGYLHDAYMSNYKCLLLGRASIMAPVASAPVQTARRKEPAPTLSVLTPGS